MPVVPTSSPPSSPPVDAVAPTVTPVPPLPQPLLHQPIFNVWRKFHERLPWQVTLPGVVYIAATVFVLVATLNSGTNLLYFVLGLMVGGMVVSLVFSSFSLANVQIVRQFGAHAIAGEPADIEYRITNAKRRWPCMSVRLDEVNDALIQKPRGFVLYLAPGKTARIASRLVAAHRGLIPLDTVRLRSGFPFGFFVRSVVRRFPQEMIVYPRIGMLNRHLALQYRESVETGTMTSNVRGGADEFYGLREYRPGDNVRAIHWRSTARTGQLMIREMAANAPPQLIVVLNLRTAAGNDAQPSHREQAERAIELAASLVCYGFFENFAVALAIAGVDRELPPAPQMGRDARAQMLRRLAVVDVASIDPRKGIAPPNRLAGRAQWIVVTLNASDPLHDLLHPHAAGGVSRGGGQHIVLSMDDPESRNWVHFLSAQDALRLLRERDEF